MANVLVDNSDYEALAELIRRERPDIVGLVEYTFDWRLGLEEVSKEFPYRFDAPYGTMGLALWFREKPTKIHSPEWMNAESWPFLLAEFEFAGSPRNLWLVHPRNPLSRRGGPELSALANRIGMAGGSQIVMGDLNCSEGSPVFDDFVRGSGLRDTRLGFGRQPSWPSNIPLIWIAIDHAFVSEDLAVLDRRLGPAIGSDHFPMILDIAPARSAAIGSSSQAK
jgi:endonuclease/exonuclease/phosphatase (EEP) superfamily protein YafD